VTPQTRKSLQMSAVPVANREKVAAIDDAIEAGAAADYALRGASKVVSQVSGFVPPQRSVAPNEASVSNES
jgi:hypothetical protein